MKAILSVEIEITDEDYSNKFEQTLFEEANEESKLLWLQTKAKEILGDSILETDFKLVKYENISN